MKEHLPLIEFLDNALLIDRKILVLTDFHIGFEEHIIEKGVLPDIQLKEIFSDLNKLFKLINNKGIKLKQIILLGDLKHEFGGISNKEWKETMELIDYLSKKIENRKDILLIKGNHDTILGPIAKKGGIKLKEFYKYKEIAFMHGHKLYENALKNSKILILGHLHPAITIQDKYKKEKYKCFLKGRWKNKQVYIIPSFSRISFGYDLSSLKTIKHNDNEFLIIKERNLEGFQVIIYNSKEDKAYNFGKLRKLIKN
jgi:putative SbcD/Mre11-related phosphoesterase